MQWYVSSQRGGIISSTATCVSELSWKGRWNAGNTIFATRTKMRFCWIVSSFVRLHMHRVDIFQHFACKKEAGWNERTYTHKVNVCFRPVDCHWCRARGKNEHFILFDNDSTNYKECQRNVDSYKSSWRARGQLSCICNRRYRSTIFSGFRVHC